MAELITAVDEFIDDGLLATELLKAISADDLKEIKDALSTIKKYKDQMPTDVEKSLDILAKWAARGAGYAYGEGYPKKEDEEDLEKSKNASDWPSVQVPADIELRSIKKEDEEEDIDEPLVSDPTLEALEDIKKQLGDKKPSDSWPSVYIPTFRKADEPEPEPEPEMEREKRGPIKTSLGPEEGLRKADDLDEELIDEWPSVLSPHDFGVEPK